MRLLVNEGRIPTVLFGPGDVRKAHRTDESVPIDDLLTVARVIAVLRRHSDQVHQPRVLGSFLKRRESRPRTGIAH
jgi:hypothetical protein